MAVSIPAVMLVLGGAPASGAPSGTIDQVESDKGIVEVLFSVTGLSGSVQPDLSTVEVTVDGVAVSATATPASEQGSLIGRTTVLVIDASESMKGQRIAGAKAAALAFVDEAPRDIKIGLTTFANTADNVQEPTRDRAAIRDAITGVQLSRQTHLYDGLLAALAAAGAEGQRRLILLTDGHDTSGTRPHAVLETLRKSGVTLDAVGLAVSKNDAASLSTIAETGRGTLVNASDPEAVKAMFSGEAEALAEQVLVSFPIPADRAGSDATISISIDADGVAYADEAFVSLAALPQPKGPAPTKPIPVAQTTSGVGYTTLLVGLAAVAIALLLLSVVLLGVFRRPERSTVADRLAGYSAGERVRVAERAPASIKETALGLTTKVIGKGGFEAKLAMKLDAAGLSFKPPEWILVHAGATCAITFLGFLVTSGNVVVTALALVLGLFAPRLFLGHKASRRIKGFNSQLPETMQLVAGGLSAGLSLSQALDTIVREGTEPMAGELKRALIETRLGVSIEDALDGVAQRMDSTDFEWVVMAVRIQRDVGGNLGELLLTVSSTLREREYLRRQVRSLSAEGRLSAYILCGMPPLFMVYLQLTNPKGLAPMYHTAAGLALLGVAAVLMVIGTFWMSKVVKVEA
jgi:tight adherence protein B